MEPISYQHQSPPEARPLSAKARDHLDPSFQSQFRAVFRKNATLHSRQRAVLICQVIILLNCLLGAGIVSLLVKTPWRTSTNNNNDNVTYYVRWPSFANEWTRWGMAVDEGVEGVGQLPSSKNETKSGLLGNIPQTNATLSVVIQKEPYWKYAYYFALSPFFDPPFENAASLSKALYQGIVNASQECGRDSNNYNYACNASVTQVQAGFVFHELNSSAQRFHFDVQFGMDVTLNSLIPYYFDVTMYRSALLSTMSNAFLKTLNLTNERSYGTRKNVSNIQHGVSQFSVPANLIPLGTRINQGLQMGCIVFALNLLLPLLMFVMIVERESGLLELQKLMGLRLVTNYFVNFLYDSIIYYFCIVILIIMSFAFKWRIFREGGLFALMWIPLLVVWGAALPFLSWLWSCVFSNPNRGMLGGFFISIAQVFAFVPLNFFVFGPMDKVPFWIMLYPPAAFTRLAYLVSHTQLFPEMMFLSPFHLWRQIALGFLYLVLGTALMFILSLYFNEVVPRKHGEPRSLLFPLYWLIGLFSKRNQKKKFGEEKPLLDAEVKDADPGVAQERELVASRRVDLSSPLIVDSVTMLFPGPTGKPFRAVSNVSVHMERGECFGLLGPNGAGKTTLISIITGLVHQTSGSVTIAGVEASQKRANIGYCPQFELLWDELSVLEHLLFFSRLKGYPAAQENEHVEQVIATVGLEGERRRLGKDLSGGQRRRLSIAISLLGNPDLVILDEPTTGLDPTSKRGLWDVILAARAKYSILLTTHSMEEADVLCSRIGIMAQGELRALGTQQRLKTRFGNGFKIQFTYEAANKQQVQDVVQKRIPGARLIWEYWASSVYQIPRESSLADVFAEFEMNKRQYGIKDVALSQSSLEEVFMNIIGDD